MIRTALLSTSDKTGLAAFAKSLKEHLPEIRFLASGNTAKMLREEGLAVQPIEEATGFPECFGGRVKTLHPRIAGGILFKRGRDDEEAKRLGIEPIDLVVCNLYAFEKAASNPELSVSDLFEQMDIGGSTLIRSACKNSIPVLTNPNDYGRVLEELKKEGGLSQTTRDLLALRALQLSASYEAALYRVFSKRLLKEEVRALPLTNGRKLRYGENPDQEGWVYGDRAIGGAQVLGGKELSYNNYEDASNAYQAALGLIDFGAEEGAVVVKHGGLCGYAAGRKAFQRAWEGDPKSAYGSVIALLQPVDERLCEELKGKFIELLIAPAFSEKFVEWAKQTKPNMRLLQVAYEKSPLCYRGIAGGMLVQTAKPKLTVPAGEKPLCAFAVAAAAFSKSNAIAIAREIDGAFQLIGVGAGQPNRVDSLEKLAIPRALEKTSDLSGCVLASDGFFPFADSIEAAGKAGVKTIVQPGGSIHDKEVIEAAERLGIRMVLTGERTFYH